MFLYCCFNMNEMTSVSCLLLLFLFLASVSLHDCSAIDIISVTKPIQDPNFIVSSDGTFKLGFFSPENSTSRYVGILYNVPKMRAVWVANRNKPLNHSSGVVLISEDGNLVVLNGKEVVWSSNATTVVPNSTAQLLDSGNLVLRDSSSGKSVWDSFQNPTDTCLPGMKHRLLENRNIQQTSWTSPTDPSAGSFTLGVDPSRITEVYVWNNGVVHWRSGPWDGKVLIGVPRMGTYARNRGEYWVRDIAETIYFTYYYANTASLVHFQLTSSGDIRHMVFNERGNWTVVSSSITSDCDLYGKCGPNGICDPKGSPICSCLKGFEPKDEQEWTKGNWTDGCIRKALLQCQKISAAGVQGEEDNYLHLKNVKVPDLSDPISTIEEECGDECLKKCSCSAYTYVVGIGCLHWAADLIDIQQFPRKGSDLYVRVAHSEHDYARRNMEKKAIIATPVTVGGSLFLCVLLYILCNRLCKHRGGMSKSEYMFRESIEKSKLEELPFYSYENIAKATENFNTKNKLGQGGFGSVYKGELVNGQEIAVKRLSISSTQGMKEFMNEVTLISKLQHRNLVRLLGCCVERDEKMLVYEYMPNKSLDSYIYDSQKQDLGDWNRRLIIIEGISRGLLYLHRDSRLRIIHRDLKASNILLDEDLNPKISDFGLARTFGGKQYQARTKRIVGTYGYMAPEYAMGGNFSEKSDVYSFGVLLLEIVSGKKNSSFHLYEENLSLLGYAWKCWNENETAKLPFMKKPDPSTEMEIQRCIQVGLLCVQESADDRPNMSNVLLMLTSEFGELPRPKLPAYTARLSIFQEQYPPQRIQSFDDVSLTDVEGR